MRTRRYKPQRPITYYHLMTRTAQQYHWLEDHHFRDKVQSLIQFYCKVYYVDLLRFAVLGNHYHVVVKARKAPLDPDEIRSRFEMAQTALKHPQKWDDAKLDHYHRRYTDISMFAWEINFHSACKHNRMVDTKGHLWGARFKSQIVQGGDNLLKVMAYVDLNAFAAHMVDDPVAYPYCSAHLDQEALKKGKAPGIYPAGFLGRIPTGQRGWAYLVWLQYLAALKRGESRPSAGRIELGDGREVVKPEQVPGLINMAIKYQDNPPPGWRSPVFGSPAFVEKVITETNEDGENQPQSDQEGRSRPPPDGVE